jgi:hypothetical protein
MVDPIQLLTDKTLISGITQQATGFSLPPFIPFRTTVAVKNAQEIDADEKLKQLLDKGLVANTNYICPLTLQYTGMIDFTFPLDPVISMSSKNIIIRRYVNKSGIRGSIKERWSQDDWEISISGVICEEDACALELIILRLREFCSIPNSVGVACSVFNDAGITQISIESLELPFTAGPENQAFVIKAYSDDAYTLLKDIKHV